MYSEGTGKWVLGIFIAIFLAVTACFPQQVLFVFKFLFDLVVLNLKPFFQDLFKTLSQYWPF